MAKELEKNDHASISVIEKFTIRKEKGLILPTAETSDPSVHFDQLEDFPSLEELRMLKFPEKQYR